LTRNAQGFLSPRFFQICFWAAALLTFAAAVAPADVVPQLAESDKLMHFLAFFTLSLVATLAFRRARVPIIGVGLSAFGALIEVAQTIPGLNRDGDVWDWTADTLAIVVVLLPIGLARWRRP